jgi:hypothetical protein
MCFVITQPELLASRVPSAAADDVFALTAAQFATHAQIHQGARAQGAAVHELFPSALTASSYAAASRC